MTEKFIEEGKIKDSSTSDKTKHRHNQNLSNTKSSISEYNKLGLETITRQCRNNIEHLNSISNITKFIDDAKCKSYYSIFHYIIQKTILETNTKKSIQDLKNKIDENKSAYKDLTKWLFLPFAYNQARYKNLTIEDKYNKYFGWERDDGTLE